ncbi:Ricin-type beta-trefoil lectin domain-like [Nannocystis exedens]|uniref:Ricin-type beta-trefoil lectin domain-like n=1 Tax=Nannocystis exedens TaxID=54 RepID=A0A1I1WT84_9BACT|nr:RICIN domain-containing protein [Nannocystis exedens]PCC71024.1 glycosyl hydrolase family 5 [Nannocystis exedens]SFD98211.1 Ricin-type beta-trefoil lectin domain-like [Nannocystis exedens]
MFHRSRKLSALVLPLSVAAALVSACDEPDAPALVDGAVDTEVEESLAETSPYRLDAGLAVPLSDLDPALVAVAEAHLRIGASEMQGAENWEGAALYPLALPMYRPDIEGPAYYEFKIVRAGEDAGFIVVSTGEHDNPLPEFNTRGVTPGEHLAARASEPVAMFWRLDAFLIIAENATGAITAATSDALPVPQAEVPAGDALELADWSVWPSLRRDFARGFAREIAATRASHAQAWRDVEELRTAAREAAELGDDVAFRRHWWNVADLGATLHECENNWAGPEFGPAHPNDLTARWDQVMWDFRHVATSGNALCASGCTPTGAGIVLAWMDAQSRTPYSGPWSRPDMGRAFFRYRRNISVDQLPFVDHGRPPYIGLPAGQSMISKAGLYDYSAAPEMHWIGQTATPSPLETATSTVAQEDMRRYLLEIGMSMKTGCSGTAGNTIWWDVGGFQRFLDDHRIPAQLLVDIHVFGHPGVRDRVIDSLRNTGAPGFVHTGGYSGHTEVVNAHLQCRIRDKATNTITYTGPHYFYMNKGWGGGNTEGWLAIGNLMMSATLTPKSPWQELVPSHSGQCADVPYGDKANGLGLQQFPCAAGESAPQRWRFLPQSDGSYMIESAASGKCIEVYGYSLDNNAQVVQWDCYGGNNQKWRAEMRPDGQFQLRNVHSGKCLEVLNFGQNSGAQLVQYTCDGAASQVWDLRL